MYVYGVYDSDWKPWLFRSIYNDYELDDIVKVLDDSDRGRAVLISTEPMEEAKARKLGVLDWYARYNINFINSGDLRR